VTGPRRPLLVGFVVTAVPVLGLVAAVALTVRALVSGVESSARAASARPRIAAAPARATPATPARHELTVAWVGDMTLGSRYGRPVGDGDGLFDAVRATLRRPDLTLGNLEGTLGTAGTAKCGLGVANCFAFQGSPRAAGALRRAGFDGVNLANNHADDYGPEGRAETAAALARAGVAPTGMPGYVRLFSRAGRTVAVVGFASYTWSSPLTDLPAAAALVREAAAQADIVVVLFHGGAEGADRTATPRGTEYAFGEDRGDLRAFAHTVVDAGADLVLGSGPHVLRGLERYRGRLVAYSLGNFAAVGNFASGGVLSLSAILDVRLGPTGALRGGRLHSIRLEGEGTPVPDAAEASSRLVAALSRQDFGAGAVPVGARGELASRRAAIP
jgi:hypothetical protein